MKRVWVREEFCIACHLCEVWCRAEHSQSRDLIKAHKEESPRPLSRIQVEEKGVTALATCCVHCDDPPCVPSCLTGALYKDEETGQVKVAQENCIGCWTCIAFCPYDAIKADLERGVIAKCDLCPYLPSPSCVAHCPNEALVFREKL